jgi:tol-pal system protein YbgF
VSRLHLEPLALVLLLSACSSQALRPRDRAGDETADLKARILELQRQVTVHELEITRLRERLAELEARQAAVSGREPGRPTTASPAAPPRPAAVRSSPPPRAGEPMRTEARVEEEDLAAEPVAPPAPALRSPSPPTPPPPDRPAAVGREVPIDSSGQALYDQGYALYHQGRYVDAESTFRRFLHSYGSTELSDNAAYWIGEARFARGDHRGALAGFREAVERYPQGNKLPDSLLKVGRCLEELGDGEGARDVYTEVIRRFPGSAAAATAEERQAALP